MNVLEVVNVFFLNVLLFVVLLSEIKLKDLLFYI